MSNKVVSLMGGMAIGAMIVSGSVMAQERTDVLERIKPIGQVVVEKAASAPAQPVAAAPATPTASAPVAKPATTESPPAATPAGPGAELYASKGCAMCHGDDGKSPIMSTYPKVAGQSDVYILNQLKDIKSGARNNGQSGVMKGVLAAVSDAEMEAIAKWLSTQ